MATDNNLTIDLPFPESVLSTFRDCGVGTVELINCTKTQFVEALSRADVEWRFDHIWKIVQDWRQQNKLENVQILHVDETCHQEKKEVISPEAVCCLLCIR
ncbi:uncharacterized protein LOC134284283 [Aedes albopictus]|uniref:Uncharacterized protein n=1 Tax=Aedes albopictus TaxID=7160 RepID=A0ABM1ZTB0_AEDAL